MRQDWESVQRLAKELGNAKWQYRALAQLSMAAFYDADLETSRKDIGTALAAATSSGDVGGQIRCLTVISGGLLHTRIYDQALAYLANIDKIAAGIPDAGYQFTAQEMRIAAFIGLRQFEMAQNSIDELLMHARKANRSSHEAMALKLAADLEDAKGDRQSALPKLDQALAFGESAGLTRVLAEGHARASEIYRKLGDLDKAERSAESAAAATQASGDLWAVPQRLQALAEDQIARGRYADADRVCTVGAKKGSTG